MKIKAKSLKIGFTDEEGEHRVLMIGWAGPLTADVYKRHETDSHKISHERVATEEECRQILSSLRELFDSLFPRKT